MIFRKFLLAAVVFLLPLSVLFPVDYPKSISCEFKQFSTRNAFFKLMQGKNSLVSLDGEGLVFDLPVGRKGPTVDGVVSQVDIRGDFEITLRYDQLTLLGDPAANGTGVAIWMALEVDPKTGVRSGATMSRHWRPEGPRFVANKITFQKLGEKMVERYQPTMKAAPVTQSAGRLRLSRKGSILTHWVSQSAAGEFEAVHSWEMGTADVNTLRFQVVPGGLDKGVKVRLLDAQILATGLFSKSGQPVSQGKIPLSGSSVEAEDGLQPRSKMESWVWILLGGAAVIVPLAGAVWWFRLRNLA